MTNLRAHLDFVVTPQPDDATCGPACLHAIYNFWGDPVPLENLIAEIEQWPEGGTLAVHLARHAIGRGYDATIYTCDLHLFDPTWFTPASHSIQDRLRMQAEVKSDPRNRVAALGYIDLLDRGGTLLMEDITPRLIEMHLLQGTPIIAGLSATWLYRCARERPDDNQLDDVAGYPTGHFVVIHGIDPSGRVKVADPWGRSPHVRDHLYEVEIHRLIAAILLGIVTHDAKLLIVRPRRPAANAETPGDHAAPRHRE